VAAPTDAGAGNPPIVNDNMFDEKAALDNPLLKNRNVDPQLTSPYSETMPNFKPTATSPVLMTSEAAVPPSDGFFDNTATFVGAIGTTDWTTGWTAYPEN